MNAKFSKIALAAAVGFVMALGGGVPALAHGSHHHHFRHRSSVFIGIGDPFWPWYGPPYMPYAIAVPTEPPTYIEKGDANAAPGAATRYYCEASQAYYPAVIDCPAGWRPVTAPAMSSPASP